MKPDERAFWKETLAQHENEPHGRTYATESCTETGDRLSIPPHRVYHFLRKAERRGYWECGVNPQYGWFTATGVTWVKAL